jgi:hypothetical protein
LNPGSSQGGVLRERDSHHRPALLKRSEAGSPAFEALRELAARKLPEIDALIARSQEVRAWLLTAADCSCTTLDVCALFASDATAFVGQGDHEPLRITRVGSSG